MYIGKYVNDTHVAFLLNNNTDNEEWNCFVYFNWITIVKSTGKVLMLFPRRTSKSW